MRTSKMGELFFQYIIYLCFTSLLCRDCLEMNTNAAYFEKKPESVPESEYENVEQ